MTDSDLSPAQQRSAMRDARRSLSVEQQRQARLGIAHVCASAPPLRSARRVGAYVAFDGELDLSEAILGLQHAGIEVFVPVVVADALTFRALAPDPTWTTNRFGIAEPAAPSGPGSGVELRASDLDAMLMPAVAVDLAGNRIGMGGGFYDRALEHPPRPLLVATVHEVQIVERITPMTHDVPVHAIATPTRWIDVSSPR